jgi:iron complex outermembrane receptor protein
MDGDYDNILYDLTGDGVIDGADYALELPRLVDSSYGITGQYSRTSRRGVSLTALASFAHKDAAAGTDNNLGVLSAVDMLDASLTLGFKDDRIRVSFFGRNLLDEVVEGGDGPVPFSDPTRDTGDLATLATMNRGKRFGIEINARFE